MLGGKQGKRLMPVGMFRSEEGWVQVDYGTGNIPITRSKYEENKYRSRVLGRREKEGR